MKWILMIGFLKISGIVLPSARVLLNGTVKSNTPVLVQNYNNVITVKAL